jgi:hypothetical protein
MATKTYNQAAGADDFGDKALPVQEKNGGPPETRTPDPLIKSQLLYQLS